MPSAPLVFNNTVLPLAGAGLGGGEPWDSAAFDACRCPFGENPANRTGRRCRPFNSEPQLRFIYP